MGFLTSAAGAFDREAMHLATVLTRIDAHVAAQVIPPRATLRELLQDSSGALGRSLEWLDGPGNPLRAAPTDAIHAAAEGRRELYAALRGDGDVLAHLRCARPSLEQGRIGVLALRDAARAMHDAA